MIDAARNVAIHLARRLFGQTLAMIGDAFRLEHCSSLSIVISRMKQGIANDRSLRRKLEKIERALP